MRSRNDAEAQKPANLVGDSEPIRDIRQTIGKIADSSASVLITGPSGSGKDVVAQLLHQRSSRTARPFVALNCAAIASDLLESEMFGHEAGAFTGALRARQGRFEAADAGTLFLDEVGDMSGAMQAKLLRVLETRIIERVGGMTAIPVNVRLIAATSIDLFAAISRGRFRSDLLYRLDVVRIEMPSLAERRDDIPLLVEHFCCALPSAPPRFDSRAMEVLMAQPWLGNVRELRNLVERAQALFAGEEISAEKLEQLLRSASRQALPNLGTSPAVLAMPLNKADPTRIPTPAPSPTTVAHGVDLKRILHDLEHAYIVAALTASGGAVAATAKLLGLQRTTLIEKMRRMEIAASPIC